MVDSQPSPDLLPSDPDILPSEPDIIPSEPDLLPSDPDILPSPDILLAAKDLFADSPCASTDNYISSTTLCDIIKAGDVEELGRVLSLSGVDLAHHVIDSTPILHFSIRENQVDVVKLLLSRGVDVDQEDGECRTPLHIATSNGRHEVMRLLMEHPCRLDLLDNFGQHPLHTAVDNEDREAAELLLEFSCDVDTQNMYGKTALHLSLRQGYSSITRLLLEHDARTDKVDNNGQTAVHIATKVNNLDLVKEFSGRPDADFNLRDKLGRTPLLWAVNNVNVHMTFFLCKVVRVDTSLMNYFKETALFTASWLCGRDTRDHNALKELILTLLDGSTNLDTPNCRGVTPLQLFVEAGHLQMVHLFLLNGADVNQRGPNGRSLLHSAVKSSNLDLTEMIMGFAPSLRDEEGETPLLHVAAYNGDNEIVELLLSNGVEREASNCAGQTALHVAAAQHHMNTLELLLTYGLNRNARDETGNTPLHLLVSKSAALNMFISMRTSVHRRSCRN